jgi:putative toxin-antitoxin system antitoxin component (TIGR02293 family)
MLFAIWPWYNGHMTINNLTLSDSKLLTVLSDKKEKLSDDDILSKIREGFPFSAFEDVRKEINLSQKDLSGILEITERTLSRRKATKRFNSVESDRLYRVIRILLYTESVFGDSEKAQTWLKRPNRSIGGKVPMSLLDTDLGTQQVEDVLKRIEYGIYS